MSLKTDNSGCEHDWVEYDDPAAYKDGFNCPTTAMCNKCGASQDVKLKYAGTNALKWHENILLIPLFLLTILYIILAPILIVISGIKDEFISKRSAG